MINAFKQSCRYCGRFFYVNLRPVDFYMSCCKCHRTKIFLARACEPASRVSWHCLFLQTLQNRDCTETRRQRLSFEQIGFLNLEKYLTYQTSIYLPDNLELQRGIMPVNGRSVVCNSILCGKCFLALITFVSKSVRKVF